MSGPGEAVFGPLAEEGASPQRAPIPEAHSVDSAQTGGAGEEEAAAAAVEEDAAAPPRKRVGRPPSAKLCQVCKVLLTHLPAYYQV
jgi:hypothetical protein